MLNYLYGVEKKRCLYKLNTQRVKGYTGRRWLEFLNVA